MNFRGNIQSRVRKLQEKQVDCTLLAIAGLNRMDMTKYATHVLPEEDMLPAISQGAIGIACRTGDAKAEAFLAALNDMDTHIAVNCERSFLTALGGSCRTPIAGYAQKTAAGKLFFRGLVASPDGTTVVKTQGECAWDNAEGLKLGKQLGDKLKADCGEAFFSNILEKTGEGFLHAPNAAK